ncbi:hypothetical protein ACWE42_11115 [Sutcliffiella cohnii]
MNKVNLEDYLEISTTLQIYEKDFLYICFSLASQTKDVSDLVSLVEIINSKESKKGILEYLIEDGKKRLKKSYPELDYKESWGNPRIEVMLNKRNVQEYFGGPTTDVIPILAGALLTREGDLRK